MNKKTIVRLLVVVVVVRVIHHFVTQNRAENIMNENPIIQTGDVQEPLTGSLSGNMNDYTLLFSGTQEEQVTVYHTKGISNYISFINSDANAIKVSITYPDGSGNLRLAQIIMPDGTADGPFGQEATYALTQSGGYQLRFDENMMAGDPRSGNALITVSLQ